MRVLRLKNSAKGTEYRVQVAEAETAEIAEAQLQRWWESGGTVSVCVVDDKGDVDSIYTRDWIDNERVPKGWMRFYKPTPRPEAPKLDATPEPEREPPTIFNEDPAEKRQDREDTLTWCACCNSPRPIEGYERDSSPSGRLAEGACMACGRRLRGVPNRAIMAAYNNYLKNRYQRGAG